MKKINKNKLIKIKPRVDFWEYCREIISFKELLWILARRDISVRYKQTLIGVAWSIIQPFVTLIIFTIVFSKIAKLPPDGSAPYALMVYAALIPWQFFSTALVSSSSSLIDNSNLISKVYFPRIIIPTATVGVSLVDLVINLFVLLFLFIWYSYQPSGSIIFLPLIILMAFLAIIGPGLLFASINVKYRDFRYIIPFLTQIGIYISPVGFSSSVIPEKWKLFYYLNPMSGVIDGFRWCIIGKDAYINIAGFAISWMVILILLVVGFKKFRNSEKDFADNL